MPERHQPSSAWIFIKWVVCYLVLYTLMYNAIDLVTDIEQGSWADWIIVIMCVMVCWKAANDITGRGKYLKEMRNRNR